MPSANAISLVYYGRDADHNRLNIYDASHSYYGLARTLAVLGHYYLTGEIIVQAPKSAMPLYLVPPEAGSFKQTVIAGVVGTVIGSVVSVPFTHVATRIMESWVPPSPNAEMIEVIKQLKELNEHMRQSQGLPKAASSKDAAEEKAIDTFMKEKDKDLQVLRSVTSQSFKGIYRPIGRSADQIGVIGGLGHTPRAIVDEAVLKLIQADRVDEQDVIVMAVVNSFSRSSKTGIVFSRDYMSSFRVEYPIKGRLPREDAFSWSQFSGNPIRMTGRFVRFYDGKLKKFLVRHVERVTHQPDIDDYFKSERVVLVP